ncbi:tudor domain-containing protein 7A [Leuresthes tenuis]|uniref:tudor domain-containing protein 7A n=1 Tax=Leuresthes tenuis TaxID=355514 RepID=UPI003B51368A
MSDSESIKKMLRSVLQSSKTGVSITSLQSEYRSLCGENIPLRKLGFSKLEDYLRSVPSVVRLEYRTGELKCFAAVCEETAHIAELVAKQRSSKKSGRSQVVNCKMRFKPSNPYMLNVTPRSSLRQPSVRNHSSLMANRSWPHGGYRGCSASGDYRQLDQKLSSITPVEHRQPAAKQNVTPNRRQTCLVNSVNKNPIKTLLQPASRPSESQTGLYDVALVQSRITQLLAKYSNGLWMSKLSEVYSQMFSQKLHPQALMDLEKWPNVCMVEKPTITNRADRLVYPPLPPKPSAIPLNSFCSSLVSPFDSSSLTTPTSPCPSTPEQLPTTFPPSPVPKPLVSPKSPLAKPTFIFPPQAANAASGKVLSPVTLRSPVHKPDQRLRLPQGANLAVDAHGGCKDDRNLPTTTRNQNSPPLAPTWTCLTSANTLPVASPLQLDRDILPLLNVTFSPSSNSTPCPSSNSSSVVVPAEVSQRIKELLSKYSNGLWAHALPKLFMDTYKMPFPEQLLDNLSVLLDICNIEYPFPRDKKKAILYNSRRVNENLESQQCRSNPLPSGVEVLGSRVPPRLTPPSGQYSSVLVTEAKSSNAVTIRYVGENYSTAQEAMEDVMHSFYSPSSTQHLLSNPIVGQLVAVRGEDGDDVTRAQVLGLSNSNRVKVYFVDHGFSVETDGNNLLELHQDFLALPFQSNNVKLAGLEAFSSHPTVLSSLEQLAVGKILLMETLEPCQQNEVPVAVLYDTSQDEDININSSCLKALQDKSMNNPLSANVLYQDVFVSDVCADGTMYCQLPSRGTARLRKLLDETEAYFISQMTSEFLVSRPFYGKFCLARYKGKWARAEITSMYSNRVIEILFIDLGVSATVEVTDLREIPPLFQKDFTIIPPQANKCRLAELTVPGGDWSHEAILWLKEVVLGADACKMKVLKSEEYKGEKVVLMYLFIGGDGQELHKSINCELAQSDLWKKLVAQNNNTISCIGSSSLTALPLSNSLPNPTVKASIQPGHRAEEEATKNGLQPLPLPPPLELPQTGQNMDVFVPVACHPGYFVLQPWQDLNKLVVLMGEMVFYYNQKENTNTAMHIQKGDIYAAKIDKNWHRVQVKGVLANGLVSVYELDYGKHELVRNTLFQPLIEEFRQLPFQSIAAQLAGMTQQQWSEEASMLFRNHVEKRALVAQVESVQDVSEVKGELWKRRLTVYLVDTTLEDRDLWIHSIMADIGVELSSAV